MMYNVKLTLDNKKVIDINGHISYENMSIIGDHIFYNIEIDKNDIEILISNGLSVCKHHNKDCPILFDGSLTDDQISLIKDKYAVYYLHRRNRISISEKEEFYTALKSLVSNPNQINPKELSQEDINNELIISKLEIYDTGNLIRTESFNNGVIISNGDVKQLIRCKKINDIGISNV